MSKNNASHLFHVENTLVQHAATPKSALKKPYRKPQCTLLGDLDAVQASPRGKYFDGPNQSYFLPEP